MGRVSCEVTRVSRVSHVTRGSRVVPVMNVSRVQLVLCVTRVSRALTPFMHDTLLLRYGLRVTHVASEFVFLCPRRVERRANTIEELVHEFFEFPLQRDVHVPLVEPVDIAIEKKIESPSGQVKARAVRVVAELRRRAVTRLGATGSIVSEITVVMATEPTEARHTVASSVGGVTSAAGPARLADAAVPALAPIEAGTAILEQSTSRE